MSLQYIIDGYNLIRHRSFRPSRKIKEPKFALLSLIRFERLCGSPKNKVTIVFDGYADIRNLNDFDPGIRVIFSQEDSADDKIKKILIGCGDPKNCVVISDDREIKFYSQNYGASCLGIEEFINPKKGRAKLNSEDSFKTELTYTQMHEINKELRKKWLE